MEIYKNIQYYEEISSTNEYAVHCIVENKPPELTVIVAHSQKKGKGQRGNSWHSNPGENLTFSIILYPNHIHARAQFLLSECISLALADVVSKYCKNVSIKWPNDIYVKNKKIAGILIEHVLCGEHIQSSIVGVGLNCNQLNFPHTIPNPTSLAICNGQTFLLEKILQEVLAAFELNYKKTYTNNNLHLKYIEQLYMRNKACIFHDENGKFSGTIRTINEQGMLKIEDELGIIKEYAFKQVAMQIEKK